LDITCWWFLNFLINTMSPSTPCLKILKLFNNVYCCYALYSLVVLGSRPVEMWNHHWSSDYGRVFCEAFMKCPLPRQIDHIWPWTPKETYACSACSENLTMAI
jgi:hypothetical protein